MAVKMFAPNYHDIPLFKGLGREEIEWCVEGIGTKRSEGDPGSLLLSPGVQGHP